MGFRVLDVNVISAKDLKDVNFITKMDVFAVVSVTGGDSKKQKAKTPVKRDGCSPTWNFPVKFTVDESLARQNRLSLVFKIKSECPLGDKEIGEVVVPFMDLLHSPGDGKSPQFVSYQVWTPSGKPKGQLHFSYKFGDGVPSPAAGLAAAKVGEPVTAYPVAGFNSAPAVGYPSPPPQETVGYPYQPPAQHVGYPPPPQGYPPQEGYPPLPAPGYGAYPPQGGYPPLPAPGYGAYPPQGGYPPLPAPGYGAYPPQGEYGYPPPVQQQPPKKNKLGMGLGAGLLGKMLVGLFIKDTVSDAADFDGGDMDIGRFDF